MFLDIAVISRQFYQFLRNEAVSILFVLEYSKVILLQECLVIMKNESWNSKWGF